MTFRITLRLFISYLGILLIPQKQHFMFEQLLNLKSGYH